MRPVIPCLFLYAATVAACTTPAPQDVDPAAYEEAIEVDIVRNDQIECRYEKQTGSHMVQRVCMSVEQRREIEAESQQWMRTGGRSGSVERVQDPADPRNPENP